VVVFDAGTLGCVDPRGATAADDVTSFRVGVDDQTSAVVADGKLVAGCSDLAYAKNVIGDGSATVKGLCGNPTADLDPTTARCFAQNPDTGALAVLRAAGGSSVELVAACYSSTQHGDDLPALDWTKQTVDTSWRVVSVAFDAGTARFVASVTKDGVPATATFACA
jgi:hypothetical protein